jgi:hypothetical protein
MEYLLFLWFVYIFFWNISHTKKTLARYGKGGFVWMDGCTDMTELAVAIRNFAKAPERGITKSLNTIYPIVSM